MELNEPLYNAVYLLEKSDEIINQLCKENEERLIEVVHWQSMHDMYKRNYEYCCGILSCFLVGQFPSSEALCRTAIEGAINLHYVSLDDSMGKQIAYFKNHIETERKQNKSWRTSVEQSNFPDDAKEHHYKRIEDKDQVLNFNENALRQSLALSEIDYDTAGLNWPNTFERFKEAGKEVGYRTVYAALCSQAHNDAEDSINQIISRVVEGVDGLAEAQQIEQYNFSLSLLLTALEYHVLAAAMYISKFSISSLELVDLVNKIVENTVMVVKYGPEQIKEKISIKNL